MYIIEQIIKYIKGKKYKSLTKYSPDNQEEIIEQPQECEHLFMPLDNSKEYFACKYCGIVVSKDKLNQKY